MTWRTSPPSPGMAVPNRDTMGRANTTRSSRDGQLDASDTERLPAVRRRVLRVVRAQRLSDQRRRSGRIAPRRHQREQHDSAADGVGRERRRAEHAENDRTGTAERLEQAHSRSGSATRTSSVGRPRSNCCHRAGAPSRRPAADARRRCCSERVAATVPHAAPAIPAVQSVRSRRSAAVEHDVRRHVCNRRTSASACRRLPARARAATILQNRGRSTGSQREIRRAGRNGRVIGENVEQRRRILRTRHSVAVARLQATATA